MKTRTPLSSLPSPTISYSDGFKRRVIEEIQQGLLTCEGARRKYRIGGKMTVSNWYKKYHQSLLDQNPLWSVDGFTLTRMHKDEHPTIRELKERIRALETALADEKIKSMAFETMIDLAEEHYQIPIRKNSGAKQ